MCSDFMMMSSDSKMPGCGPTSPSAKGESGLKKLDFADFKKILGFLSMLIFPYSDCEEDCYNDLVRVLIASNFLKFKDDWYDRLHQQRESLTDP